MKATKQKITRKVTVSAKSAPFEVIVESTINGTGLTKEEMKFAQRKLADKITKAVAQAVKPFSTLYPHEITVR